jgi:mono/diheme cytochrome c family protein
MTVVRSGVMAPKKSAAIMPPFGGSPLDDRQLRAVAMYVRSLGGK